MNENLQPGHLDADALSAFAEGALIAHERVAALAHLAVCPVCRKLVQLAQPPFEEMQTVAEVSERRGFAGWRWVWTGAMACAGIALATVVLLPPHHAAKPQASVAKLEVLPPPPDTAQPNAASPPAAPTSTGRNNRVPQRPPAPVLKPSLPAAPMPVAPMSRARTAPPLTVAKPADAAIDGLDEAPVSPKPSPSSIPAAAPPQPAKPARPAQKILQLSTPAPAAPPPASPSPGAYASAPQPQAAASEARNGPVSRQSPGLPSHLAVASSFAEGPRMVAADSAGTVFLSLDAGLQWAAVKATWSGRAVRIEAAGPQNSPQQDSPANEKTRDAKRSDPVFALISSTGERWVSPDGTTWSRQ